MPNKGNCQVEGCNHEAVAKQYCRKHYRLWKGGEMPKPRYKICTQEKCRKPRAHGSLCEEHYAAARGKAAGATPAAGAAATGG